MKVTRRTFMTGFAASAAALLYGGFSLLTRKIAGGFAGPDIGMGHRLRDGKFSASTRTAVHDVVIVGGGIAGLAAGYRLTQAGFHDFIVLDLDKAPGGNSVSGKNEVSAYPWGAHYVTLAPSAAKGVRKVYEDFGVITGADDAGRPIYNEYYLASDLTERLYIHGRWQEGLFPVTAVADTTLAEYERFLAAMDSFRHRMGTDGRAAFAIPVDASSHDPALIALDKITMKMWMEGEGYSSPELHWYVDYCCRDDFGTTHAETSAWAGVHYFAGRDGAAVNAAQGAVLTWPEGNGWLVDKLSAPFRDRILTGTAAQRVALDDGVTVDCFGAGDFSVKAKAVVMAVPQFIGQRLLGKAPSKDFTYAPWAVANITLDKMPAGRGVDLAWDNVVFQSKLLGYVVATHQSLKRVQGKTVVTYYWPLSGEDPATARRKLLAAPYEELRDAFLEEFFRVHPEMKSSVAQVDIWRWGHGMIRPVPGFIWGEARAAYLKLEPPIFHAHSDMSGISIFEEACTHGIRAAEDVLRFMGKAQESWL